MTNLKMAETLLQQQQQDSTQHEAELQDLQQHVHQLQQQCEQLRFRQHAVTLQNEELRAASRKDEACWREKVRVALGVALLVLSRAVFCCPGEVLLPRNICVGLKRISFKISGSTIQSRSGMTILSMHNVDTHQGNELMRNSSGNTRPQSSQLVEPL